MKSLASPEAEQAVLGGLMLENERWDGIAGRLKESDFHRRENRAIFRVIARLASDGKPVDAVTVADALDAVGELAAVGGLAYVGQLVKNIPSATNTHAYADLVADKARRRDFRSVCQRGAELACTAEDLGSAAAEIGARFDQVALRGAGRTQTLCDAASDAMDHLDALAHGERQGIPTGLAGLDHFIGGLQPGQLIILAARPACGKTSLAMQIALHAASCGHPVGVMSLEMTARELASRAMAHYLGARGHRLLRGDEAEVGRAARELPRSGFSSLPIHFDEDTYSLQALTARVSQWSRTEGIGLAIVDHIGLIEGSPRDTNRNEWLGVVTRQLKQLAKRLGIPILALSQLNRGSARESREPNLADLRDSGHIEQDADAVLILHPGPDRAHGANAKPVRFLLAKNRNGPTGSMPGPYFFDGSRFAFSEGEPVRRYR